MKLRLFSVAYSQFHETNLAFALTQVTKCAIIACGNHGNVSLPPGAAGGHLKNDRAMYDNKHNSDINPAYDNYKTPQCLGFEGILYDNKENVQQVNGQGGCGQCVN